MAFENKVKRISQLVADVIIGARIATADIGQRVELNGSVINMIQFFTGHVNELISGRVEQGEFAGTAFMRLDPSVIGADRGVLTLGGGRVEIDRDLVMPGGNGQQVKAIRFGVVAAATNTDASGDITVTHGCTDPGSGADLTPDYVFVTPRATTGIIVYARNPTATQFKVLFRLHDGTVHASAATSGFYWLAVAL